LTLQQYEEDAGVGRDRTFSMLARILALRLHETIFSPPLRFPQRHRLYHNKNRERTVPVDTFVLLLFDTI
jgi:hypothetical protein